MRITTIAKVCCAAMIGLSVLIIGALWFASADIRTERSAVARQMEFHQLGLELADASDYLTNQARLYAVTGDRAHYDNYWREVKETKTRDHVVARLKQLGAPASELKLIEQAKANSDALIRTEAAAMKAVAAKDFDKARSLMFGPQYDRDKAVIMKPLRKFQTAMNARAAQETAVARSQADRMMVVAAALILLTAIGTVCMLYFMFGRRVATPLAQVSEAVGRLARKDMAVEVGGTERQDEIGDLVRSVQVFKDSIIRADSLAAEQQAEQAQKDARAQALATLTVQFEDKVRNMVDTLSVAARQLNGTAQTMSSGAEQTSARASMATSASEEASANVQAAAAAAEELVASVAEISRQVTQSATVAKRAADEAERTDATVQALADGAQRIDEVVSLISSIAGQTNLLALNATIEAARAGEAGKGFAVVANEVKALANQTAKATDDIAGQVAQVQASTREAVQAIKRIGSTITEVSGIANAIAAAVEEQGSATQEIARNVQHAASGTSAVTQNIGEVTRNAAATGHGAGEVLTAAEGVMHQSEELNGTVAEFLRGIRAS